MATYTLLASDVTGWETTVTEKNTDTFSCSIGDVIILVAGTKNNGVTVTGVSGLSGTWTEIDSNTTGAVWYTVCTSNHTSEYITATFDAGSSIWSYVVTQGVGIDNTTPLNSSEFAELSDGDGGGTELLSLSPTFTGDSVFIGVMGGNTIDGTSTGYTLLAEETGGATDVLAAYDNTDPLDTTSVTINIDVYNTVYACALDFNDASGSSIIPQIMHHRQMLE